MSTRSIAEGKVVMAELASIDAKLAIVEEESIAHDEKGIELRERRRVLLAKRAKLFAAEAGTENPVDLRTKARRRREHVPRKTVAFTEEDSALADKVLADNEWKRRSG
jgi:hypothetical protein